MAFTRSQQNDGSPPNKQCNTGKGNDDKKGSGCPRTLTFDTVVGESPLSELIRFFNILALIDALERAEEEPKFNKGEKHKRDGDDDGDGDADQHRNKSVKI